MWLWVLFLKCFWLWWVFGGCLGGLCVGMIFKYVSLVGWVMV